MSNPSFIFVAHRNCVIPYCQVVILSIWDHEYPEIGSHQEPTSFQKGDCCIKFLQIWSFDNQKIQFIFCKWRKDSKASLRIEPTTFVSIDSLGYHNGTSVLYCCSMLKFPHLQRGLIIDQICRKRFFSKIIPVFRKYLSVSPWNLSRCFSVSFRFLQVTEFGKLTARAIYLANSFCQLYSALWSAWLQDPNNPQERCAMVRTSCARQ